MFRFQFSFSQISIICLFVFLLMGSLPVLAQTVGTDISLNHGWLTRFSETIDSSYHAFDPFEQKKKSDWKKIDVPHNWDDYFGYRRLRHGNLHGYAYYYRNFTIPSPGTHKSVFLFFEGVGSYATIWLNGQKVGYHAGGRTSFTIEVSRYVKYNQNNTLAVRADHPANIKDLPWVCGGCSDDRGFSEGSQPIGIFRPVHLIIKNEIRIEPFGVHVWNDTNINKNAAQLHAEIELKNYGVAATLIQIKNRLLDRKGNLITEQVAEQKIAVGQRLQMPLKDLSVDHPHLWSLEDPYLYTVVSELYEGGKLVDALQTKYGIRKIRWPSGPAHSGPFFLNNKPVFINGIAEYEHLLGSSHAFGDEQIRTRAMEVKVAGFNAFRDAHQPHNLRYQNYWDSLGILWWPQMSAHDWYDTPEFRNNFKTLLEEWVKERRNSPSVILWGLQNESKIPEDFSIECSNLIRKLDPTASTQRLVTTCNGGTGTDWDVPQNWTGTYGGNPDTYGEDLKKQNLVGEYGAWRTLDLHTEGAFQQNGAFSVERMTALMETKIKGSESVKDSVSGHFMWLLGSHDNPGRQQGGEGLRELDRIGPVNYKGLMTAWEEPMDAFYMYRSNYVSGIKEPMVYLASRDWTDRWTKPGKKNGIIVYSNCDEVELFNDAGAVSLGKKKRGPIGTHFTWDNVDIQYNMLYAIGYVHGKAVAKDLVVLSHLPAAPHFKKLIKTDSKLLLPKQGYQYLYRVNCGGDRYKDANGNLWLADRARVNQNEWGSVSWANDFKGMNSFFASQRNTNEPIQGTEDQKLFQGFRYGREKLKYEFLVKDGDYLVELYFAEPCYGRAGIDAKGWRLFDVAINDQTVLKNFDIWSQYGYATAVKKTFTVKVSGGLLRISFPHCASGQAIISAIAIASAIKNPVHPISSNHGAEKNGSTDLASLPAMQPASMIGIDPALAEVHDWLNTGDAIFLDAPAQISAMPAALLSAQWLKSNSVPAADKKYPVQIHFDATLFLCIDSMKNLSPDALEALKGWDLLNRRLELDNGRIYKVYQKRYPAGSTVEWHPGDLIMAQPATTMEPAYDQKPITSYKPGSAIFRGSGVNKKLDGKERIQFETASPQNAIQWNVSVGVGDIYALTLTYNNLQTQTQTAHLSVRAADGLLLKEADIELPPTKPGKSNTINTTTGTMINAGNYMVSIALKNLSGIAIGVLDVQ